MSQRSLPHTTAGSHCLRLPTHCSFGPVTAKPVRIDQAWLLLISSVAGLSNMIDPISSSLLPLCQNETFPSYNSFL